MNDERQDWASPRTLREIAELAAVKDHRLGRVQTGGHRLTSVSAQKILAYLRNRPDKPQPFRLEEGDVVRFTAPESIARGRGPVAAKWPLSGQGSIEEAEDDLTAIGESARREAAKRPHVKVERDGFFEYQGVVYKVQRAVVTGSGHLYAKRFDQAQGKFVMAPGMLSRLSESDRLGPDKTAEFGKLYGVCLDCGSPLTDEESLARGRGLICEGKLGERSWY
jgi:Family of unknown function (DUF6011)